MERVILTTSSTADLPAEALAAKGIAVAPLHVLLGENEYFDGVDISPQAIFDFVKETGMLPKTSAITVDEFIRFFSDNLKRGDKLIHFEISGECSSTVYNAEAAAKSFGGKVRVIDTRQLSSGQGLCVLKACDLREQGKTADEIFAYINAIKEKVQTSFVVDTVEYLYKGGRCSAAAKVVSDVLKIHPSIFMKDGALSVRRKYMGNLKRCISGYVTSLAEEYKSYDKTRVFITHSHCDDDIVAHIKSLVEEKFDFKEIIVQTAGSVITSHCGKGTLGVLFVCE